MTFINGNKGVTLGSIGDGNVQLKSTRITAEQGDIQLVAGNGVSLQANTALLHKDLKGKAPLIEPNLRRNLGKWST